MRKGQDRLPDPTSSDESTSSDSDGATAAAAGRGMKRSRGFSTSFSLDEDPQLLSTDDDVEEDESAKEPEKPEAFSGRRSPGPAVSRPQDLWLAAVSQCLAFRWPPCSWFNGPGKNFTAGSAADGTPSGDVTTQKEKVRSNGVKSGPGPFRGISRFSPGAPGASRASDSAAVLSERETFLRIELVEAGREVGDSRYRAEWKLSETSEDLAEGVWFSRDWRIEDLV